MIEDKLKQSLAILNPIRTVELKDKTGNFEAILQGLLSDLETPNTLSVLLCEQIAESIFWMRRHVEDKELILLEATAEKIDKAQSGYGDGRTYTSEDVKQALLGDEMLNIRHLQRSLDAIDMKSRIIKRMDLELERIERDLTVLEHDPEAG